MASTERNEIKLKSGTLLHQLSNEGHVYGFVEVRRSGLACVWRQVWSDEYQPTPALFPGFISAARAVIRGEV